MAAKPLTKEEKAWLKKLQDVLNECPSKRLGSYTTGDSDLQLFDTGYGEQINDFQTKRNCVIGAAIHELEAELGSLNFPFQIQHG